MAGAVAALALTALAACTDATGPQSSAQLVQLATSGGGGSAAGGGGGGGGGGGAIRSCALLTLAVLNNLVTNTTVPSFWQPNMSYVARIAGTTEKTCDVIPGATIVFEDLTGDSGCSVSLTPWVNNPAYLNPKYGAKPMSRFQEAFIYYTGADCIGRSRVLRATLTDPSAGGATTSVTMNWVP